MARRYGEPIDVRSDSVRGEPRSFLWRGRVYLVREVLDHWWERQAWWAAPAARAVHGDEESPGGTEAAREATRSALNTEREIWRVEAARGRYATLGVFDLCHDYVMTTLVTAGHATGHATTCESPGATPDAPDAPDAGPAADGSGLWHLVRVGD